MTVHEVTVCPLLAQIFEVPAEAAGVFTPKYNLEPPHYDGIQSLAIQGHTLFSGSRDTCIKKWDLGTQQLKQVGCSSSLAGLTCNLQFNYLCKLHSEQVTLVISHQSYLAGVLCVCAIRALLLPVSSLTLCIENITKYDLKLHHVSFREVM